MIHNEPNAHRRERYLTAFANAANFAIGNRFFLSMMLRAGLADAVGDLAAHLVYDAPHNLLWPGAGEAIRRIGATPAGGPTESVPWGEPVIVPAPWAPPASCSVGWAAPGPSLAPHSRNGVHNRHPSGYAARRPP